MWIDFQSHSLFLIIIIFAFSLVLAFLSYRFTLPPLSTRKKVLLLALRWMAIFCLFLALSETLFGISKKSWEKPQIALLLDSSKSMNLKDKETTRKEILQGLLQEKSFKEVLSKAEVTPYFFSDSLTPYDLSERIPMFKGEVTVIGNNLEMLKKSLKGKELSAVLLFSDGANNAGKDPVAVARDYNLPIYTIGLGEFIPFKDISLEGLKYNEVVYSKDKDSILIRVKNQGYTGIKVPVTLQEGKEILARKEMNFGFSGEVQEIWLAFEPSVEGIHNYQMVIPKVEGESFVQNNQKSFTQKVLKKRFKLLLVSQSLNWEYTFLKRFLSKNQDITFESLVFSNSDRRISDKPELSGKLKEYDLLILLDSPEFLIVNQKEIKELLQGKGVSLLIFVGEKFYQRGDLSGILDFLPFEFEKKLKPLRGNFNLELNPEGRLHPVTRLSDNPEENISLWTNLPPFERMIPLKAKDKSKVLAFSKIGQESFPGIIIKEMAKGKIGVLSFSPLWKWDFLLWGIGRDNSAYKRFWENSFRWLLSREDLERFRVFTDKNIYRRGEEINFGSRLLDESYQKIIGADIRVKVFPKGKEKDSLLFYLTPEEGYSYTLSFLPPDEYSFKAEAKKEDFVLGVSQGEFKVEKTSLEDEDLKPNKELLKEIALLSGGEYFEPENFPLILKSLDLEKKLKVEKREIPIWNQPLLLFLFILFLSLEWFFRKRFQLL